MGKCPGCAFTGRKMGISLILNIRELSIALHPAPCTHPPVLMIPESYFLLLHQIFILHPPHYPGIVPGSSQSKLPFSQETLGCLCLSMFGYKVMEPLVVANSLYKKKIICGMSLCKTAIKKLIHNVVHGHSILYRSRMAWGNTSLSIQT